MTSEANKENSIIWFFKDLIIIVIIVVLIRSFLILPFKISGQSMYSSYYDRQFIIVDRFSYLNLPFFWITTPPKRWDVVVFNTHIEWKQYFIKRIIGTPWETIKISWWKVFVKKVWEKDFKYLDEKYLMDSNYNATYIRWSDKETTFIVPDGQYFVMWDNRNASTDSRTCFSSCDLPWKTNFIHRNDLMWKVFIDLGYFNISKFSFKQPDLWIDTTPKFFSSASNYDYK